LRKETTREEYTLDWAQSTVFLVHSLIPPESTASQNYNLRPHVHNLQCYLIILIISLTVTLSCGSYSETFINIWALDSWSKGRWFDYRPGRYQVN